MIEQEFFGIERGPEDVLVGLALARGGVERLAVGGFARLGESGRPKTVRKYELALKLLSGSAIARVPAGMPAKALWVRVT